MLEKKTPGLRASLQRNMNIEKKNINIEKKTIENKTRTPRLAAASREVILSAGAIGSPHLLQLSGVGPGEVLERIGVAPVLHLPGVGENLQGIFFV